MAAIGLSTAVLAPASAGTTTGAVDAQLLDAEARSSTIRMVVGPEYVDSDGNTWATESGFRGGSTTAFLEDVQNTKKDALYQRERYGVAGYDIPVQTAGTYRTTLNLAEMWFSEAGQRVFDVSAEDSLEVADLDIFARAGSADRALSVSFDTEVTDGVLDLDFTDKVNHAKVDSIRVELLKEPPAVAYAKVASVDQNPGESWADACQRTMTYGYTGCVAYLSPKVPTSWTADLQELAEDAGDRRVDIQLTAKKHDHDGLADVLANVPAAWKPTFIYNIFQEPEDNLTTEKEQADYRADYTDAATVTREYGFQLPWLELQEWGVNPANHQGWNTAGFFPPAGDYQGVLWSLFEFNQRDLVEDQVTNITDAMATFAPGKPWGLMASEYALPADAITDTNQRAQGAWLTEAETRTREAGSQSFGWFNMLYNNGKGLWEGRVEVNSYALAALRATP